MRRLALYFSLMAAICAGPMVWGAAKGSLSGVLLPAARPAVFDTHARCQAVQTQSCAVCHPKAAGSRWASERLVPPMERCAPCHATVRDVTVSTPVTEACRKCHSRLKQGNRPIRGDYPRPNIRFSHAAHAKSTPCKSCHPLAASGQASNGAWDIPPMRHCYECHRLSQAPLACTTCHLADRDGRMVTDYREKRLIPPDWLKGPTHGASWVGRHATTAGADSSFCASCHRESFCRDCHTGRLRPRNVHPSDWLSLHGVSTRLDNPRCRGCHRKQSFCLTCHRRSGVAPDSPANARPAGLGRYHRNMQNTELMQRARRDITTCVSCHSESSCIACHAIQKPHPPRFRRKCRALAARNRRACAKCHTDEAWKRCDH
ncbi:MAG: hypothetical protein QNJ97_14635 [Myxococcota bacterium]|nr:hypothetical protein [Myxococcota bacterium]